MGIFKLMHIKERRGSNKAQGLKNALNYIFNPVKTEENLFVGGIHCPTFSANAAYSQMVRTKKAYGKEGGRQGYHFILSFPEREHVSADVCKEVTQEIVERLFDDFEVAFAVHTDQKHMHSHIVFNSVSYKDGLKYHYNKGDWKKLMMPVINEICKKHGLEELELEDEIENRTENKHQNLPHSEQADRKNGRYTMLQHIQIDIDNAIAVSEDYIAFLNTLRAQGYTFRDGVEKQSHLSLLPPFTQREKFIRTDCLGDAYMPAGIKKRISGEWNIKPYEQGFMDEDEGELFATKTVYRNRNNKTSKRKVYSIKKHSVFIPKEKYRKLSDLQKRYLKFYRYFSASAKTREAMLWHNNANILTARKMNIIIVFMVKHNINSVDDLKKYEKNAYQRKMAERIRSTEPSVSNWKIKKKKLVKKEEESRK